VNDLQVSEDYASVWAVNMSELYRQIRQQYEKDIPFKVSVLVDEIKGE